MNAQEIFDAAYYAFAIVPVVERNSKLKVVKEALSAKDREIERLQHFENMTKDRGWDNLREGAYHNGYEAGRKGEREECANLEMENPDTYGCVTTTDWHTGYQCAVNDYRRAIRGRK